MEALYAKLYNKYETMKKKRISELDEINKDQEVKFLSYVSAAEDMIKFLRCENEKLTSQVNELRSEVNELRSEVASIRSTKDEECARYKQLLVEESQKNKMLSEEVKRLKNLQETSLNSKKRKITNAHLTTPDSAQATPTETTRRKTRKQTQEETAGMKGKSSAPSNKNPLSEEEATVVCLKETSSVGDPGNERQLQSCSRVDEGSDANVEDGGHVNCHFQTLIECLLGMKVAADNQTDKKCILAVHESSGYSFSLMWVKNENGKEEELMYRVSRLGAFDKIAPEWMRSTLMFSIDMWPIFFERLVSVLKTQC